MAKLQMSMGFGSNPRTHAILNGVVNPEGIELVPTSVYASELFWRQLRFQEFDVSEMSLSSFLILLSQGNTTWVGLPIFTFRKFFHTEILVRTDAGIDKPQDLRGKKVGVPEYQQTAALWTRGALQHEFGVFPQDMEWYMERTDDRSHGAATGFTPPPGVRLNYIPAQKSIGSMLLEGELDASIVYLTEKNLVDRSRMDFADSQCVRRLFSTPAEEGIRYYQKTGIFPINHCVVIKRTLLERHPWVALNLYKAFQEAKESVLHHTKELVDVYFRLGLLPFESRHNLDTDPYPYGIKQNRHLLETLAQYSHEQGLTPRVIGLEEVFAASTLEM